jgi:GNAT superfamily N-acetyltransferase
MRFRVEQGQRGNWRVMLEGADAPVSEHDTEDEARERLAAYEFGAQAAAAPTLETGIARGDRATLPDGTEVIVRQVRAEDAPLLLEGFQNLGEQSRYQRFMAAKKRLSPSELAYFTDLDHDRHEAIGALDPNSAHPPTGIGIARFVREHPGGPSAEAAVAVSDEWQGRGLGGVLLDRLAERAREVGITEFTASLLATNRAMLALFAHLGRMEVEHDSGTAIRLNVCLSTDGASLREALRAAAAGDVRPEP